MVALMQQELQPLVEAMIGYVHMLRNDAADRPAETRSDLDKLHECARQLYAYIKEFGTANWSELQQSQFDERLRKIRHDIANRLNHALGYCQFLILDEKEQFFGQLIDDFDRVRQLCKHCEAVLLRFKSIGDGHEQLVAALRTGLVADVMPHFHSCPQQVKPAPASILVVDDSRTTCELLAKFLERQKHTVCTAENGLTALDLLATRDFDLVILDYLMPEMNGFNVLQRIKSHDRLQHTPVIMVSALDSVADMVPCIESGADDFLTKPVDFGLLEARVNASLERMRLREREFGQFFTAEVARHLVRNPDLIKEGREAEITVMFCDVRGFSRLSERLGPSVTFRWLSDVMAELSECVLKHRGVLVDYIGDELMAMWGTPENLPDHAELACAAAFEMISRLPAINERWRSTLNDVTDVGIGLSSGMAHVGNTGSRLKFKYGPLGNTVNLASRAQGATKYLSTRVLVTGSTKALLSDRFATRRLCQVRVVNIHAPVELYELLPQQDLHKCDWTAKYERALQHFEEQRLPEAAAVLGNLLVENPQDGPSLMLMSRVVQCLLHRNAEFDPVWELPGK